MRSYQRVLNMFIHAARDTQGFEQRISLKQPVRYAKGTNVVRQPYTKISVTLPPGLLAQVDSLARQRYSGRSAVIQSAVRDYIMREAPGLLRPADQRQPSRSMIERMRREFPDVRPDDIELLQLLTYYKYERKD